MSVEWLRLHRKYVFCLLLLTIGLAVLQTCSSLEQAKTYVKEGTRIVAIQRASLDVGQSVPLQIEVEEDGKKKRYEVTLSFSGVDESTDTETHISAENLENSVKSAIDKIASTLETRQDLLIPLPQQLENGCSLLWKKPVDSNVLSVLLIFPFGLVYLYYGEIARERQFLRKRNETIRRALPTFNDQLLMLMNSGLIFPDAYYRIADNLKKRQEEDSFSRLILQIKRETDTSGKSLISVMKASTKDIGMREYSRMVNVIADNQYRGVDLQEKLESESMLLWEARKALSLQKGKELEIKLSFPLAVLLVVLMMIAGVPAMMNM